MWCIKAIVWLILKMQFFKPCPLRLQVNNGNKIMAFSFDKCCRRLWAAKNAAAGADSGCVEDQPQRVASSEAIGTDWLLRLVSLRETQPLSGGMTPRFIHDEWRKACTLATKSSGTPKSKRCAPVISSAR